MFRIPTFASLRGRLLSSCLGVGLAAAATQAANADVLVDPGNMGDWSFANSDSNGVVGNNPSAMGAMVYGPAPAPLGVGSALLQTTSAGGAEILSNTGYAGVLVSSLTTLTYSAYSAANNGQQFPYLALEVEGTLGPNGPTFYDTLFFEPPYQTPGAGNPGLPNQGPTQMNTWQTWNALEGGWWDNDGLCTPGTYESSETPGVGTLANCTRELTNAEIINEFGFGGGASPSVLAGVGGVQLEVGFDGSANTGYVDALTIGVNGNDTTYNFDPSVPEPGTLALIGTGLLGAAASRRRRRKK